MARVVKASRLSCGKQPIDLKNPIEIKLYTVPYYGTNWDGLEVLKDHPPEVATALALYAWNSDKLWVAEVPKLKIVECSFTEDAVLGMIQYRMCEIIRKFINAYVSDPNMAVAMMRTYGEFLEEVAQSIRDNTFQEEKLDQTEESEDD